MDTDLVSFIASLRRGKLDDEKIRSLALEAGDWSPKAIDAALTGQSTVAIATPSNAPVNEKPSTARPELSIIKTVFLHISLWIFMVTALWALNEFVSSSENANYDSYALRTIVNFIAVTVVTGLLYGAFYLLYLKGVKRNPTLTPGRTWSIITMSFALVALIGYLIVLIIAVTNSFLGVELGNITAPLLSVVILLGVILNYWAAAFLAPGTLRKILLIGPGALTGVILIISMITAAVGLPASAADSRAASALVSSAQAIGNYATANGELPSLEDGNALVSDGVTYKVDESTGRLDELSKQLDSLIDGDAEQEFPYELCATFVNDTLGLSMVVNTPINDQWPYEGDFELHRAGENCFPIVHTPS